MKKSKEQKYIESLIVKEPHLNKFLNENSIYLDELGLQQFGQAAQQFKQKFQRILYNPETQNIINSVAANLTNYDVANLLRNYYRGGWHTPYALAYIPMYSGLTYIQRKYGDQIAAAVLQKAVQAKQAVISKSKQIAAPIKNINAKKAVVNTGRAIGRGVVGAAKAVNTSIRNAVPILKGVA